MKRIQLPLELDFPKSWDWLKILEKQPILGSVHVQVSLNRSGFSSVMPWLYKDSIILVICCIFGLCRMHRFILENRNRKATNSLNTTLYKTFSSHRTCYKTLFLGIILLSLISSSSKILLTYCILSDIHK